MRLLAEVGRRSPEQHPGSKRPVERVSCPGGPRERALGASRPAGDDSAGLQHLASPASDTLSRGQALSNVIMPFRGDYFGGAWVGPFHAECPPSTLVVPWSPGPQARSPALGLGGGADQTELPLSRQMAEVEAAQLKEEGNRHFQCQDYKEATKSYSQALKLTKDKSLLATLYRNRAACGLKMVCAESGVGAGLRGLGAGRQGWETVPVLIGIGHCPSHLT